MLSSCSDLHRAEAADIRVSVHHLAERQYINNSITAELITIQSIPHAGLESCRNICKKKCMEAVTWYVLQVSLRPYQLFVLGGLAGPGLGLVLGVSDAVLVKRSV